MRGFLILGALLVSLLAPAAALQSSASRASGPVPRAPQLIAFRGFHLGGGGFGRRRFGSGGFGRRRSSHALRRVAHVLAFAYVLHLLFSHGGISILIWLLVIGLMVHFVLRGRRRRAGYA